jgi:Putative Flp pilus-assembly TadE/G-like
MTPTHPAHPPARGEDGQILILTMVVALALLAILGLVADGGLLLARHRELQAVADAAARAGAAQLDEATYRASDGRIAQLDPVQARAAARRHLGAAGFTGVDAHVIPRGCVHVIPRGVALGWVLPGYLLGCHVGPAGPLVGPVAGAVHEDLVAGVDEPVQQRLGDDRVGEQRIPVNR